MHATSDTVSAGTTRVALLGVPVDLGASQRGTVMGPAALRTAGLLPVLQSLGLTVEDHGDVAVAGIPHLTDPPPDQARHYREIQSWTRAVSASAYRLAGSGAIPLFLGGDHTLSMGSVNGVARHWQERGRELFLLWLDAHADFNTPMTTVTGNMHGMSAAFLCGEPGLAGLLGDEPRVSLEPGRLELFGIRAVDRLERQLLQQRRIGVVDMRKIDECGVGVLLRDFLARVQAANGVLHVSFDVDFLDPDLAPGVGTMVPGGATYREAHLAMELLHDSGLVVAADVVELNPFLDDRGRTARIAVELVGSLFGQQITERHPVPVGVSQG